MPFARRPAGRRRVVDLSAPTVLPGLIDCHAHMVGEVESGHGYASLVMRTGGAGGVHRCAQRGRHVLAGFTTVRDVGTFRAFVDVALRDAINAGVVLGPRMLAPAPTSPVPAAAAT